MSHSSRPLEATPAPSAMPPATSHRTGHWSTLMSSPDITCEQQHDDRQEPDRRRRYAGTGSVSHSSTVIPATT